MSAPAHRLLSGRLLATNTLWTLIGFAVPGIAALAVMPSLVRGFGDERFGVLTLAWTVIGYFSLFDLGLGRAVTRQVSGLLVSDRARIGHVVWTGWYLMIALGLVGGAIGLMIVPPVVEHVARVSPELRAETLTSFYLVAFSIPLVVLSTGVSGVLGAAQRFDLVNAVRVPSGLLTFLVPLVVLRVTPALPATILALIALRVAVLVAYCVMCFRSVDGVRHPSSLDPRAARELLRFGGWLTVSNVVSPLMWLGDRFFVSALISVSAVTYYATPSEAVLKALIIPTAVTTVLFPAFSAAVAADRERMIRLFRAGVRTVFLAQLPVALLVIWFAPDLLRVWLGTAFELRSTGVMRWLMLGVFVNGIAFLPFTLLQGVGRSDVTARLHVAELPFYFALLVLLVQRFGIDGAAIAWCIRVTVDLVALLALTGRLAGVSFWELLPRRRRVGIYDEGPTG